MFQNPHQSTYFYFSTNSRPLPVCKRRSAVQKAHHSAQEHQVGEEPLWKPGYQGKAGPVRHGKEEVGRGKGGCRRQTGGYPGNAQS